MEFELCCCLLGNSACTTAFTFKTLLRHYAKRALTPRFLNVKLGPRRNYHKAIRHFVITNLRIELFEALLCSHLDSLGQSCVGCDCSVLCYMLHAVATEPEQCHLPCVRCCNSAHYNTSVQNSLSYPSMPHI